MVSTDASYAVVVVAGKKLQVNARDHHGRITQTKLNTPPDDLEGGRTEAKALYPDRRIIVPGLGENPWKEKS